MHTNSQENQLSPQSISTKQIQGRNVTVKSFKQVSTRNNNSTDEEKEPQIENYFTHVTDNQMIKVTKIIFQTEVITLTDYITLESSPHEFSRDKKGEVCPSTAPQENSSSDSSTRNARLPVQVKTMLRKFKEWLKEHRPELLDIFQQIKTSSYSEKQIIQKMSSNIDLRQSFLRFTPKTLPNKKEKFIQKSIKRWNKSFQPAQQRYNKSDEFLEDMLILTQRKK